MKTIRVQDRDKEIFRFIYENLYVTIAQVHRAIFKDKDLATSTVRLCHLHHGGYLKKLKYGYTLLKLTRDALDEISDIPIDGSRYIKQKVRTYQIGHDLGVIDTKIILKESPIISNWVAALDLTSYQYKEHEYSDEIPKTPDAVFDFRLGDKVFKAALEYELTQKNSTRYRLILERYYVDKKVDALLYIVKPPHLKKTLLDIGRDKLQELSEREVTSQNMLYVTTLDEFQKYGLESPFEGTTGKTFSIKEWENRFSTPNPSSQLSPSVSPREG